MPTRIRLSRFLAQHAGRGVDLDVEYERGRRVVGFRVVVVPGLNNAIDAEDLVFARQVAPTRAPSSPQPASGRA